jgi:hypothetical protein
MKAYSAENRKKWGYHEIPLSKQGKENYDRIFGKKPEEKKQPLKYPKY